MSLQCNMQIMLFVPGIISNSLSKGGLANLHYYFFVLLLLLQQSFIFITHFALQGARYMIELLFKTIAGLEPLNDNTERSVVQRTLSTLSHQNMVTEPELLFSCDGDIIQRTSNNSELMKEATASRMMYFFMHLLHHLRLEVSSEKESATSRRGSNGTAQNDLHQSSEVNTGSETSRSESFIMEKRDIGKRRRSSFIANEIINQELL